MLSVCEQHKLTSRPEQKAVFASAAEYLQEAGKSLGECSIQELQKAVLRAVKEGPCVPLPALKSTGLSSEERTLLIRAAVDYLHAIDRDEDVESIIEYLDPIQGGGIPKQVAQVLQEALSAALQHRPNLSAALQAALNSYET